MMIRRIPIWFFLLSFLAVPAGCSPDPEVPEITLVIAGQALIKKDPRLRWEDPFGSLRDVIQGADVAFTNFEMAVGPEPDRCGIPENYETSMGEPSLPRVRNSGLSPAGDPPWHRQDRGDRE